MDYVDQLKRLAGQPLTHQLLLSLFENYQRPNDKIHTLMQEGMIQPIKKGLYITGASLHASKQTEPFLLANHIVGPSYVSVETALSYYGIIPERVYEIASMTIKAARQFKTVAGTFTYTRLALPYYSFGIRSMKFADDQYALIASPEKALCDKIITTSGLIFRSKKAVQEFLFENMRMDEASIKNMNTKEMLTWLSGTTKEESLSLLINVIKAL